MSLTLVLSSAAPSCSSAASVGSAGTSGDGGSPTSPSSSEIPDDPGHPPSPEPPRTEERDEAGASEGEWRCSAPTVAGGAVNVGSADKFSTADHICKTCTELKATIVSVNRLPYSQTSCL